MMSGMLGGKIGPTIADAQVERSGELALEAVRGHGLDLDAAEAADVGERGAAHAGEDQAADDVDLGEPAMDARDEGGGEAVDHLRDARLVHQVADEDEHRHGDERKGIEGIGHALADELDREAVPQDVDDRRDHHGEHHGPAEQEE